MTLPSRSSAADEFGVFQTPADLAERVCSLASRSLPEPATVIEPTCGTGIFFNSCARSIRRSRTSDRRQIQ